MENTQTKPKRAYLLVRAIVIFVVFLVALAGIYRIGNHHFANVAEWAGEESAREVLQYGDTTYHLAGKLGSKGISTNGYKTEELLGEVKPKGLFDPTPPLLLWSVKDKEGYMILIDENEDKYLYFAEGQVNPAEPETQAET